MSSSKQRIVTGAILTTLASLGLLYMLRDDGQEDDLPLDWTLEKLGMKSELELVQRACYAEASNPDTDGPDLIAWVIRNRIDVPGYGDSAEEVVTFAGSQNGQPVYHFSSYAEGSTRRWVYDVPLSELEKQPTWKEVSMLVEYVMNADRSMNPIPRCLNFVNPHLLGGKTKRRVNPGDTLRAYIDHYDGVITTSVAAIQVSNAIYDPSRDLRADSDIRIPGFSICPTHRTVLDTTKGPSWAVGLRVVPESDGLTHWFLEDAGGCQCLHDYERAKAGDSRAVDWWQVERKAVLV